MRRTTIYILASLGAAIIVGLVSFTIALHRGEGRSRIIRLGGATERIDLKPFDAVSFEGCKILDSDYELFPFTLKRDTTLRQPRLLVSSELREHITLTQSGNRLSIRVNFPGVPNGQQREFLMLEGQGTLTILTPDNVRSVDCVAEREVQLANFSSESLAFGSYDTDLTLLGCRIANLQITDGETSKKSFVTVSLTDTGVGTLTASDQNHLILCSETYSSSVALFKWRPSGEQPGLSIVKLPVGEVQIEDAGNVDISLQKMSPANGAVTKLTRSSK